MQRIILIVSGLVSLVVGTLLTVAPAAAQEPVFNRLVNQRVELLPQEPLCWSVFRLQAPPGFRLPPTDYTAPPMEVALVTEGQLQIEYAGGPTRVYRAGEGAFVGNNNWFAVKNTGTTPAQAIVFALSCQRVPASDSPIATHLGRTGTLPGIRPMTPYIVRLTEGTSEPGSPGAPPQIQSGPVTFYALEGNTAISTQAGFTRYGPGDIFVVPPVLHKPRNVGNTPTRNLFVQLNPAGEPFAQLVPDAVLPSPVAAATPAALPRTGEGFSWAGPLAMLVAALLLAAGIGLRRALVLPIPRP